MNKKTLVNYMKNQSTLKLTILLEYSCAQITRIVENECPEIDRMILAIQKGFMMDYLPSLTKDGTSGNYLLFG